MIINLLGLYGIISIATMIGLVKLTDYKGDVAFKMGLFWPKTAYDAIKAKV